MDKKVLAQKNNLDKNGYSTSISWYPGHMAKANRLMGETIKLCDIIIEIRDARMPLASKNPILGALGQNKPRLIILNKADFADEKINYKWKKSLGNCLLCDSVKDPLTKDVTGEIKIILKDKLEKAKTRGIRNKVLRAMVVGVPNVGKSTFINNIVKRNVAKVENKPGVTKKLTWVRINEDIELLDTPGVLWPKIENSTDGLLLALLGSINDLILDKEEVLLFGLNYIRDKYPTFLSSYYKIDEASNDLIFEIGKSRRWLNEKGYVDKNRSIELILKDIRLSRIGRISYQDVG